MKLIAVEFDEKFINIVDKERGSSPRGLFIEQLAMIEDYCTGIDWSTATKDERIQLGQ